MMTNTPRMVLSKGPGAWVAKDSVVGVDKVAVLVCSLMMWPSAHGDWIHGDWVQSPSRLKTTTMRGPPRHQHVSSCRHAHGKSTLPEDAG